MSEIEKLYKNAKIKKQYCGWLDMGDLDCQMQYVRCNSIKEWKEAVFSSRYGESEEEPEYKYPEFTAEKQLEIIKWLASRDYITIVSYTNGEYHSEHDEYNANENSLEGCLARLINNLWQDLSDTEKAEIKRILE